MDDEPHFYIGNGCLIIIKNPFQNWLALEFQVVNKNQLTFFLEKHQRKELTNENLTTF